MGLIWRGRGIAYVAIVLVMVLIAGGLVVLTVLLVDQLAVLVEWLAQFAAPSQP